MSTTFPARLVALRQAAKLSQAQLAERAGMHVVSVSKLERGAYDPSLTAVLRLAAALGVGAPDLIRGVEEIPEKT